jgi:iron-sulfur cluster repair protein YtfE (RIC family)
MKATSLLESQHRKVEMLFEKLESGRSNREKLLEELANNLAAHMAIEQDIFYPAIKEVDAEVVAESYEEHSLAEVALKRLRAAPDEEQFKARLTALKELIEHHVSEEEEELFPAVESALGDEMLEKLATKMEEQFDRAYRAGFDATVPKGLNTTSADVARAAKSAA